MDPATLALATAATSRADALTEDLHEVEGRLRAVELELATLRGASSAWVRVLPVLSLLVSMGALGWAILGT